MPNEHNLREQIMRSKAGKTHPRACPNKNPAICGANALEFVLRIVFTTASFGRSLDFLKIVKRAT